MIYGSVCSGIEAATVAWDPLGWKPSFYSDIEKFPCSVLQHHYPDVPLHGDFTTIGATQYDPIDLLVGGTPCQSFSVAGLRKGMDDDRGNLALEYLKLAERTRPKWLVWENVPGVLSSNGGRDFGSFLGGLVQLGYGFAYRVLNAQYFGVPQRRRRVFLVAYLGDWRPPASVLFEHQGLSGNIAPGREAREDSPTDFKERLGSGKHQTGCLMANCGQKQWLGNQEAFTGDFHVCHGTQDPCVSQSTAFSLGRNNGQENTIFRFDSLSSNSMKSTNPNSGCRETEICHTLDASPPQPAKNRGNGVGADDSGTMYTLTKTDRHAVSDARSIRRLTPIECERLQGFPDNYTRIPYRGKTAELCPDGPRYQALGNSMAVPVMHWIGKRIQLVNEIMDEL